MAVAFILTATVDRRSGMKYPTELTAIFQTAAATVIHHDTVVALRSMGFDMENIGDMPCVVVDDPMLKAAVDQNDEP
ncbi:uncharacterized protein PHALS_04925 [Plasmopara halstedii]|uniref:Uncharacterized protein n=1 Tax=Plasmopara halstedii TaxID=4781 RepID=A0A0P1A9D3_PLAHL|nr:uncharacterized protein PHALS_04925 [Plasmopara halstedii]CEG37325.1 hypothetical protein PHALS_04925 [Plasmopara halstedii]|eukprot:XP_024573694.1 hypothetical protein PHALS_04925 [Plasmopara halstedii]